MREFAYSNLSGREPGPFLRTASAVFPGVRAVQAQVGPYASAWQASNQLALDSPGPLWVVLGDSLSQGIGASAYYRGFVGLLHARLALAGHDYRIVNLSVSGARVSDVLSSQLPALASLGVSPALVTLLVGSNDLFRRGSRSLLAAEYEEVLQRLPSSQAAVATLPNPSAAARALNSVTYRVSAERGFALVDTRHDRRTQFWAGKLAADRFHPNDRGYAAVAAVFGDALEHQHPAWTT